MEASSAINAVASSLQEFMRPRCKSSAMVDAQVSKIVWDDLAVALRLRSDRRTLHDLLPAVEHYTEARRLGHSAIEHLMRKALELGHLDGAAVPHVIRSRYAQRLNDWPSVVEEHQRARYAKNREIDTKTSSAPPLVTALPTVPDQLRAAAPTLLAPVPSSHQREVPAADKAELAVALSQARRRQLAPEEVPTLIASLAPAAFDDVLRASAELRSSRQSLERADTAALAAKARAVAQRELASRAAAASAEAQAAAAPWATAVAATADARAALESSEAALARAEIEAAVSAAAEEAVRERVHKSAAGDLSLRVGGPLQAEWAARQAASVKAGWVVTEATAVMAAAQAAFAAAEVAEETARNSAEATAFLSEQRRLEAAVSAADAATLIADGSVEDAERSRSDAVGAYTAAAEIAATLLLPVGPSPAPPQHPAQPQQPQSHGLPQERQRAQQVESQQQAPHLVQKQQVEQSAQPVQVRGTSNSLSAPRSRWDVEPSFQAAVPQAGQPTAPRSLQRQEPPFAYQQPQAKLQSMQPTDHRPVSAQSKTLDLQKQQVLPQPAHQPPAGAPPSQPALRSDRQELRAPPEHRPFAPQSASTQRQPPGSPPRQHLPPSGRESSVRGEPQAAADPRGTAAPSAPPFARTAFPLAESASLAHRPAASQPPGTTASRQHSASMAAPAVVPAAPSLTASGVRVAPVGAPGAAPSARLVLTAAPVALQPPQPATVFSHPITVAVAETVAVARPPPRPDATVKHASLMPSTSHPVPSNGERKESTASAAGRSQAANVLPAPASLPSAAPASVVIAPQPRAVALSAAPDAKPQAPASATYATMLRTSATAAPMAAAANASSNGPRPPALAGAVITFNATATAPALHVPNVVQPVIAIRAAPTTAAAKSHEPRDFSYAHFAPPKPASAAPGAVAAASGVVTVALARPSGALVGAASGAATVLYLKPPAAPPAAIAAAPRVPLSAAAAVAQPASVSGAPPHGLGGRPPVPSLALAPPPALQSGSSSSSSGSSSVGAAATAAAAAAAPVRLAGPAVVVAPPAPSVSHPAHPAAAWQARPAPAAAVHAPAAPAVAAPPLAVAQAPPRQVAPPPLQAPPAPHIPAGPPPPSDAQHPPPPAAALPPISTRRLAAGGGDQAALPLPPRRVFIGEKAQGPLPEWPVGGELPQSPAEPQQAALAGGKRRRSH